MPLSNAAPRKHIHTRKIDCRGYRRDDGLWDIEGTLVDTKTYSFGNEDRAGIAAGEPFHEMHIRLTIDDDMEVLAPRPPPTPVRSTSVATSPQASPRSRACGSVPAGAGR